MSIHIGGRKIKTVYYGGREIREAYLGSTKVWPSEPTEWNESAVYAAGDHVLLGGSIFRARYTHRSNAGFRPGSGDFWSSAWEYVRSLTDGVEPTPSRRKAREWPKPITYRLGDVVIYRGRLYTVKKYHWGGNGVTVPSPDSQDWE